MTNAPAFVHHLVMPAAPIPNLRIEEINDPESLQRIYENEHLSHYWSTDWSAEFYVALAKAGFISTYFHHPEIGGILLPEIQEEYAVLDWEDFRIGTTMRRWMKSKACSEQEFQLQFNCSLSPILTGIATAHGPRNWLRNEYAELLLQLEGNNSFPGFRLIPVALVNRDGEVVAGEIGYRVGNVYTSLTGFMKRDDPRWNHTGKLQLHRLGKNLQTAGFEFWNLGHPHMDYKKSLGAKTIGRQAFLRRWPAYQV